MSRTYLLVRHKDDSWYADDLDFYDSLIGVWITKSSLLYYAKQNNITQKDAYVVVVIDNFRKIIKFVIDDWETRIVWRQPK